jgi:Ca2+-binding EF-hand superfamily protein
MAANGYANSQTKANGYANSQAMAAERMMKLQVQQEFTNFDKDGSGTLTRDELVLCMQYMHARVGLVEPTKDQVTEALMVYDQDSSGDLDLAEFTQLFSDLMLVAQQPRLPPQFEAMKAQSLQLFDMIAPDGKIGKEEFVSISQSMIQPLLFQAVQILGSVQGPCGPFGPDLRPAFERSLCGFDLAGVKLCLGLVHETIDSDRNGTLERKEVEGFWQLFASTQQGASPDQIADIVWLLFDRDGNGTISLEEVAGLVEKVFQMVGALATAAILVGDNILRSPEVEAAGVKLLRASPLMAADTNKDDVISREEFKAFMEQTQMPLMMQALAQQAMIAGSQQPGLFKMVKDIRSSMAEGEKGFFTKLCLKAKEWKDGGIDEVTFMQSVIPLMKEAMAKPPDEAKIQAAMQAYQQTQVEAAGLGEAAATQLKMQQNFQNSPEIKEIQKKVQLIAIEKVQAHIPDMCRNLFQLLDLDKSGTISRRELNMLKALMDGFLRLGTSTLIQTGGAQQAMLKEDEQMLKELYPDLFKEGGASGPPTAEQEACALLLAIFDVMDRNGDGSLQLEEIVQFQVSFASFFANQMKIMVSTMVATSCAMEREMLKLLWQKLEITDVSKEQVPQVTQALMMLAMSTVAAASQ